MSARPFPVPGRPAVPDRPQPPPSPARCRRAGGGGGADAGRLRLPPLRAGGDLDRADRDRHLAAAHRRLLPARRRGQARLRDLAEAGQRQGRPARPAGPAEDRRRRQQPGHRGLRLHQADHAGQGRPGARHVLLAAELPGLRGRREEPDGLRRAGRRRAEHVHPRLQVPVLRPAGDRAAPGRRVRQLHQVAAGRPAAEDRGVPDPGRPVRRAGDRVDAEAAERAGRARPSTARRTRRTRRTSSRSPASWPRRSPTSSRRARCSRTASAWSARSSSSNYSPKMLFQTSAPSNAGQYSSAIGTANTEGVFYTVSWSQDAKTPQNPEFVADYKAAYKGADPAEDAADAFAAAQVLQAAVDQGRLDRPGQDPRLAARQRGADDPRPAVLERDRRAAAASSCSRSGSPTRSRSSRRPTWRRRETVVNPKPDWK